MKKILLVIQFLLLLNFIFAQAKNQTTQKSSQQKTAGISTDNQNAGNTNVNINPNYNPPPRISGITYLAQFNGQYAVQPNSDFYITGTNLYIKPQAIQIVIQLGSNSISCSPIYTDCSDTRIHVTCGDFSGISDITQGQVTVSVNGRVSTAQSIRLYPQLTTTTVDFTHFFDALKNDRRSTVPMNYVNNTSAEGKDNFTLVSNNYLWAVHNDNNTSNTTPTTYKGVDEYFLSTQLKNNWKVTDVYLSDNRSTCGNVPDNQHSSNLIGYNVGTSSIYVKINWINFKALCYTSCYAFSIKIQGPKETNYW